jgi:hypothetical protein
MKRYTLLGIFIALTLANASAATLTFDWNGSSTTWASPGSWNETGGTGSYPGAAGRTTDIVRFGVAGSLYLLQPTLSTSLTVASIEFGGGLETSGTALTVTGATLTAGTITQDINTLTTNTVYDYLEGTGTISCTTLTVGSGTSTSGFFNFMLSDIATLNVSGNVVIISNVKQQNGCGFRLENGNMYLGGIITFTTLSGVTSSNASYFTINTVAQAGGDTTPALYLSNATPIGTIPSPYASVNFYGDAGGSATVTYTAASPTIYTTSKAGFGSGGGTIDTSKASYDNLVIQGTGTATVGGTTLGALKVAGNLTTSSPATFSTTGGTNTSVGGSWANSSTITMGTGSTAVSGSIANSGTLSLSSGILEVGGSVANSATLTAGAGNITIDGSLTNAATLTLSSGNLTVAGNYTNSSLFTAGSGTVNFNGSSAQSLTDNSTGGTTFNNVQFSGGGTKTLSGTGSFAVSSSGILTMAASNTLQTGGILTLNSASTGSASVAAIPSTSSIKGTVNAQRYLTGGSGYRSYRLISSPVFAATISSTYNVYSLNYLQSGMYVTGNSGGGFDKTGNPTIYLYREDQIPSNSTFTSGNFWGISAINNSPAYNYYVNGGSTTYNLPVGNGMMVFFRGNRASATLAAETTVTYTTNVAVTLSTTGTLNQGTIVVRDWYTPTSNNIGYTGTGTNPTTTNHTVRGFNLVGNPYASSIDWSTFSSTNAAAPIYGVNVSPSIWIFNPHTKNYDTYNASTGLSTGSGGKIIPSGQGFFVQGVLPGSPTLAFTEAAKSTSQPATLLLARRIAASVPSPVNAYGSYLRLKLITDTVNESDMVIGLHPASTTQYNAQEDAKFMQGSGSLQSIACMSSDSVFTSVKWMPLNQRLTIPLKVLVNTSGTYTIQRTDLNAIPQIYTIWLMDNYKKDSLDIRANSTYIFDVNINDTATYGKNRFTVVLRQNPALGVHLLSFSGAKTTGGSQLNWTTENESDYTGFTLERSSDGGKSFAGVDSLVSTAIGSYNFLDKAPPAAADEYRLKITDLNGNVTYSNIITIMYGNTQSLVKTTISVYPNPAKATLNLNIGPGIGSTAVQTPGSVQTPAYNVQITSMLGTVVRTATVKNQTWQTDVSSLTPGTYVLQVVSQSDNGVVGQQKFIKL